MLPVGRSPSRRFKVTVNLCKWREGSVVRFKYPLRAVVAKLGATKSGVVGRSELPAQQTWVCFRMKKENGDLALVNPTSVLSIIYPGHKQLPELLPSRTGSRCITARPKHLPHVT